MNTITTLRGARFLLVAGAFSAVTALYANEAKSEVGRREERQQDRIANGIESGQLTPAEVARLEKREAELRDQIKNDRGANGGHLTPAERKQINAELDATSAKIYRAKHNDRTVPPAKN
jgi:hypothetical protein